MPRKQLMHVTASGERMQLRVAERRTKKHALFNGHHRILCECVHGSICGLRACNAAAASIVRPGPKEWECHICARKHGVMSTTALWVQRNQ